MAGVAGGVRFAISCGKERFDPFGTWPSNQRYKRFGSRYYGSKGAQDPHSRQGQSRRPRRWPAPLELQLN